MASRPAPARADDVRPVNFLERGSLKRVEEEGPYRFVPETGGRYFRVGGQDRTIVYGIGVNPVIDWFWPSWSLAPEVKTTLKRAVAAQDRLGAFEERQRDAELVARVGWLLLTGGVLAAGGGQVYDNLPGNPREMAPSFYLGAIGAGALGAFMFGGATWVAWSQEAILNQAIDAYNRELAGRRSTGLSR